MAIVIGGSSGITYPSLTTAPSSPVEGMTYYNSTDGAMYVYDGTVWAEMNTPYVPLEVTTSLTTSPLTTLANGTPTYISATRDAWQAWQNLLPNWVGAIGTDWINIDSVTFTLNKESLAYLTRMSTWDAVDLTGWTYLGTGSFLTGYGAMDYYSKTLAAGDYSLDTSSAMYIFTEV